VHRCPKEYINTEQHIYINDFYQQEVEQHEECGMHEYHDERCSVTQTKVYKTMVDVRTVGQERVFVGKNAIAKHAERV
jgi:hypothetical protein